MDDNKRGRGAHKPARGLLFDGRGVVSRSSPAFDDSLGGELIIKPSLLANCEGGAGVARAAAGDDWKKRGDDDAAAAALAAAVCLVLRGVA